MRVEPDLADWIRLSLVAGVGDETARDLLSRFGLPQNIFASSHTALVSAVGHKLASALLAEPDTELIKRTLDWAGEDNHHILTLGDDDYPRALLTISDPPPLLYLIGRTDLMNWPALAMVGSRSASPQGLANAEQFARAFGEAGLSIVSGMALGIDAAAHRGALACAASTIAVTGTGADIVYPSRNRDLAHEIAEKGAILSCYALGTPAIGSNFPRRNRLISGLSKGVLVVEAALQSGSLITARFAGEQGREVFAIPGSIHSPHAKGCHRLIKQGAKLVESASDVLEELGSITDVPAIAGASRSAGLAVSRDKAAKVASAEIAKARVASALVAKSDNASSAALARDPDVQLLLQHLGFEISDIDSLCELSGLTSGRVSAMLLQLELEGSVASLPGGRYQRVS